MVQLVRVEVVEEAEPWRQLLLRRLQPLPAYSARLRPSPLLPLHQAHFSTPLTPLSQLVMGYHVFIPKKHELSIGFFFPGRFFLVHFFCTSRYHVKSILPAGRLLFQSIIDDELFLQLGETEPEPVQFGDTASSSVNSARVSSANRLASRRIF